MTGEFSNMATSLRSSLLSARSKSAPFLRLAAKNDLPATDHPPAIVPVGRGCSTLKTLSTWPHPRASRQPPQTRPVHVERIQEFDSPVQGQGPNRGAWWRTGNSRGGAERGAGGRGGAFRRGRVGRRRQTRNLNLGSGLPRRSVYLSFLLLGGLILFRLWPDRQT